MKYLKAFFIISLANFFIFMAVVVLGQSKPITPVPSNSPTPIPTVTSTINDLKSTISITPTPDSRCVITVDGVKYDVSTFRDIHSGGDVFQFCTDMSSIFHGQHPNSYLNRMQQYRIN